MLYYQMTEGIGTFYQEPGIKQNPQGLYEEQDPIGIDNDSYIRKCADKAEITIACRGNHGSFNNRSQ